MRPTHSFSTHVVAALVISTTAGLMLNQTAVAEPSQKPLFKKSGRNVAPNIFYTMDDSGSMARPYAPDTAWGYGTPPVIHRGDALVLDGYGCQLLTPTLPITGDFRQAKDIAVKLRSPHFNKIYYNPEIRYQPWAKGEPYTDPSTGLFAPSAFSSAPIDPLRPVLGTSYSGGFGSISFATPYKFTPANANVNGSSTSGFVCANNTSGRITGGLPEQDIHPATYYLYDTTASKYVRYSLYTGVSNPAFKKYAKRTDCAADPCTLEEEQKNFANWFTYYRTRSMLARGASTLAFTQIEKAVRVGYGQINASGVTEAGANRRTLRRGVRNFDPGTTARADFFRWLYRVEGTYSTPLRKAMDDVGRYFEVTSSTGPWGNDPGTAAGKTDAVTYASMASCRRSYHILMTDGYWNEDAAQSIINNNNIDGNDALATNKEIADNKDGRTYRYNHLFHNGINTTKSPYADGFTGTLADVAQYYWMRDLHPGLKNNIEVDLDPANKLVASKPYYDKAAKIDRGDHAFWQHLTTYTVGLGIQGTISDIKTVPPEGPWPKPVENNPSAVDDLFHAAVNGRGRYLSASNPQEYQESIEQTLSEIFSAEPANSGIALTSFAVNDKTRKYIPSFSQPDWIGDVSAYNLKTGEKEWTASSALPAAAQRNIHIWNGSTVEPFKTSLSAALRTLMGGGSNELINFLRGDRSLEGQGYRCRGDLPGTKACTKVKDSVTGATTNIGLFGDVVNSIPVLIAGNVDMNYHLMSGVGSNYRQFVSEKKARTKTVLAVGANDGMLHLLAEGTGDAEAEGYGKELYAFIPQAVAPYLKRLANVNYGSTSTDNNLDTTHRFFVDGKLNESDVYINGAWTNVLVGSTGNGAKSVFALKFDTANPHNLSNPVLWEINALPASTLSNKDKLGHITGSISTGRLKNGTWVAIFGNGMDSTDGGAYLWMVNMATGQPVRAPIQAGTDKSANGLGAVTVVRDANRDIIAAYAADAKGRLWRFDLESSSPNDWKTGFGNTPLLTPDLVRPATAAPLFMAHPKGGLMVMYATGRLYSDADEINTDQQMIYGVWDTTLLGQPSSAAQAARMSQLKSRTISKIAISSNSLNGYTMVEPTNKIVYKGPADDRGWFIKQELASGERAIFDPFLLSGLAIFNTTAPSSSQAGDPCMAVSTRTFLYFLNPLQGTQAPYALFDSTGDGMVNTADTRVTAVELESEGGGVQPYKELPCVGDKCKKDQDGPCAAGTRSFNILTNKTSKTLCAASGYNVRTWQQLQNFPKQAKP